jgi:geranylgeranyl transferase type-1 subunit beta
LDPLNIDNYEIDKAKIIDWIYNLQIKTFGDDSYWIYAGFQGSTCVGTSVIAVDRESDCKDNRKSVYCQGHLAMTYTALCTLKILGDDFSRLVEPDIVIQAMKNLQLENGSFRCVYNGSEDDMRFLYCACAISHLLDDWGGVDVNKAINYIRSCRTWDGAIGLSPGLEGHGGSVFCAIASLHLMGQLENVLGEGNWRNELIHWCVLRQVRGMQGRPNKNEDTCYSYWIGGTLRLLNADEYLNKDVLTNFVLSCQTRLGGFSKLEDGMYPDVMHSFYSLAWLSLASEDNQEPNGLRPLDCALGMAKVT